MMHNAFSWVTVIYIYTSRLHNYQLLVNKKLSYRRETALQGAL